MVPWSLFLTMHIPRMPSYERTAGSVRCLPRLVSQTCQTLEKGSGSDVGFFQLSLYHQAQALPQELQLVSPRFLELSHLQVGYNPQTQTSLVEWYDPLSSRPAIRTADLCIQGTALHFLISSGPGCCKSSIQYLAAKPCTSRKSIDMAKDCMVLDLVHLVHLCKLCIQNTVNVAFRTQPKCNTMQGKR